MVVLKGKMKGLWVENDLFYAVFAVLNTLNTGFFLPIKTIDV
jgi:hypothetical protein